MTKRCDIYVLKVTYGPWDFTERNAIPVNVTEGKSTGSNGNRRRHQDTTVTKAKLERCGWTIKVSQGSDRGEDKSQRCQLAAMQTKIGCPRTRGMLAPNTYSKQRVNLAVQSFPFVLYSVVEQAEGRREGRFPITASIGPGTSADRILETFRGGTEGTSSVFRCYVRQAQVFAYFGGSWKPFTSATRLRHCDRPSPFLRPYVLILDCRRPFHEFGGL